MKMQDKVRLANMVLYKARGLPVRELVDFIRDPFKGQKMKPESSETWKKLIVDHLVNHQDCNVRSRGEVVKKVLSS